MRLVFCVLLILCFYSESAKGNEPESPEGTALLIAKKNAVLLDNAHQILVVFNETPESSSAILVALEKNDNHWFVASKPMTVGIGRNGFAAPGAKREGDQMSPTGFFRLGQLFCYEMVVDTRMPFIQTTSEDKWIDDPNSADYNCYIRGATSAKTYENLRLNSNDYRYCMVIEYNMHPVVKGNGSAIFLHLSEGETINPSAGCIVATQKDMEWLLRWMNPELKPLVIMGNEKVLVGGLMK